MTTAFQTNLENSDNSVTSTNTMLSLQKELGCSLTVVDLESEPLEYIGGIFPKGRLSALIGESGVGKSYVLIAAALSIAANKPFLPTDNYEVKGDGKVLIIETEGRIKTYKQRILDLGGNPDNFRTPDLPSKLFGFNPKSDRERIEEVIKGWKPDLVIFDSFAGFSAADENTSSVMPCIKWLAELAVKYNAAVVFTQLVNKTETVGKFTTKSVRGFSGIHQYPEVIWAIDNARSNKDKETKVLYQVKNNIEQKDTTEYVFILETSMITFTGEIIENQQKKMDRRREILQANAEKCPAEIAKLIQAVEPETKLNTLTKWITNQK